MVNSNVESWLAKQARFSGAIPVGERNVEHIAGYRSETMESVMRRIFDPETDGSREDLWASECYWVSRLVVGAIHPHAEMLKGNADLESNGIIPYAFITGGVARNFYYQSADNFTVAGMWRRILHVNPNVPGFHNLDLLGKQAVNELVHAPFNLDIKVVTGNQKPQILMERIQKEVLKFIGDFSEERVVTKMGQVVFDYYPVKNLREKPSIVISGDETQNGKQIVCIQLKEHNYPYRQFTVDVTTYPTEAEMAFDYRTGFFQAQKQNLVVLLGMDRRNDPDLEYVFVERKDQYDDVRRHWFEPESIVRFDYRSLDQALVAGLNLLKVIQLYPVPKEFQLTDVIEKKTLQRFRDSIARLLESYINSQTEADDYRVKEIIRSGIFLSSLDPVLYTRLAGVLGILDIFVPEFNNLSMQEDYLNERKVMAITNHFGFRDAQSSVYNFWPDYLSSRKFLGFDDMGVMQVLQGLQENGYLTDLPYDISGAASLFDLRQIKQRWRQRLKK